MKINDIIRIENRFTKQLKREVIGNKLVFTAKPMEILDGCQSEMVAFAKQYELNMILHHNSNHFLIRKDGNIHDLGETQSYQANIDLADESTDELMKTLGYTHIELK